MNSCVLRNLLIWMPNNVENACRKVGEKWATLSQFDDSHTQIQTLYYCITEAYPVLRHWWVVDAILLLRWSTACFITLLSFTQHFCIAELYLIRIHCRGIRYLLTWLSNSQILIRCWAIPNPTTCWDIPYLITRLSNSQILIHAELYPMLKHVKI